MDVDYGSDAAPNAAGPADETAPGLTVAPASGHASTLSSQVTAAVASLTGLDQAPLQEHIERYQQIHSGLQDALSGIEGV